MSKTYSIGCRECRKRLWIAQGWGGSINLYSGEPETMEALRVFLYQHMSHPLIFDDHIENEEMLFWDEVKPIPQPSSLSPTPSPTQA
jgi:hypothetical protein